MIQKYTKKEIAELLGVSVPMIRKLENNERLGKRLEDAGYILVDRKNEGGNKIFYYLDAKTESTTEEILENCIKSLRVIDRVTSEVVDKSTGEIIKSKYKTIKTDENGKIVEKQCNVKKTDEFSKYMLARTYDDRKPIPQETIANIAGVGRDTIGNWDKIMQDNNFISRDGFFYLCIDRKGNIKEICKEEYMAYNQNKRSIKAIYQLQERYKRGEITLNELTVATFSLGELQGFVADKYCFRINKYRTKWENALLNDMIDMIISTKGDLTPEEIQKLNYLYEGRED